MPKIHRCLLVLAAVALMAVVAGCGGGSSTTSSTSTEASTTQPSSGPGKKESDGSGGGGQGGGASKPGSGSKSEAEAPAESSGGSQGQSSISEEEAETPDQSIQEFGDEAEGGEREAVLAAMRSFVSAMASRDYGAICSTLSPSYREALEKFASASSTGPKGCTGTLSKVLLPAAAGEARKALNPTVSKVRIGEGSAFVIFRPRGGKISYFVMKEESGGWKATSLAPGTPFSP